MHSENQRVDHLVPKPYSLCLLLSLFPSSNFSKEVVFLKTTRLQQSSPPQVDASILITANVPSAKKIIVHGPTEPEEVEKLT